MANTVGMKPYKIIHSIADMHIYENHIDAVKKQLKNNPYQFPYIKLRSGVESKPIENYEYSDIDIIDYYSHGPISADMVV
jgi:thymidylate synthase